jgi:type IX secretion system PorP/SprF family membrane protein
MKNIFTLLIVIMATSLFAQQDALFSQYMFNKLAVNPGYAGSHELLAVDLVYRYQWVNIEGAPKTISASIHTPLKNPHLALGLNIDNDKIGPMSSTGAMATFAYRVLFPKGNLSFGIQAGVKNSNINWNDLTAYDDSDPFLSSRVKKALVPDASFGIYYYSTTFYAGISTHQLLQNQTLVVEDTEGNSQFSKLLTHFYAMTGVAIPIGENVVFRPSLLAKYVKNAPPQLDLNASFLFAKTFWLGASYRTEKALSLITEINVSHNLRVGYSYDMWLNELKAYNKGSHEIRLSFDFNVQKRVLSPRYF